MTSTDAAATLARASAVFAEGVHAIRADQWDAPTPCSDWDVRALVNHVTGEDLWAVPLFGGRTIAEVGDAFDGDVLGDDPVARWDEAVAGMRAALGDPTTMGATVHLSFGDFPGSEYALQLAADHLVHGWDLLTAIGAETRLDPSLVDAVAEWYAPNEEAYRSFGAVGPAVDPRADADAQTRLLAAFGRSAS